MKSDGEVSDGGSVRGGEKGNQREECKEYQNVSRRRVLTARVGHDCSLLEEHQHCLIAQIP